ncbi:MAG: DUF1211 domain-containing protein [Thermoplasmata archaeon]|nr:DUF1211 domain-containing protein [Thermoplasmata archaeon]
MLSTWAIEWLRRRAPELEKLKVLRTPEGAQDSLWMSPNRLLGLSDGVIAIAITILAIKLIPLLHENDGNISAMGVELYQYAIGFVSLGILWLVHHHIFHIIKRADGVLVWLNIVFLALASLGPFWTAFITKNLGSAEATGVLGISTRLTYMTLLFILLYATRGHRLVSADLDERVPWGFSYIILIGGVLAALGTVVGFFNSEIFGLFSLTAAVWFVYMTAHGYKKFFNDQDTFKEAVNEKKLEIKAESETVTDQGAYWMSPERISVLTDGVVAIALTLMVLELPIPDLKTDPNGLWEMGGDFFLIGVGFLSLGLFWALHHLMFQYIKRADGALMWLNILFLAFASLVPFWVAYLNINEGSEEAMLYYSIPLTLTLLILLVIWLYAAKDRRLISIELSETTIKGLTKFLAILFIFTIIILGGSIVIPGFKYVSWIFSLIFFIYMTAFGYKRYLIPEKTD